MKDEDHDEGREDGGAGDIDFDLMRDVAQKKAEELFDSFADSFPKEGIPSWEEIRVRHGERNIEAARREYNEPRSGGAHARERVPDGGEDQMVTRKEDVDRRFAERIFEQNRHAVDEIEKAIAAATKYPIVVDLGPSPLDEATKKVLVDIYDGAEWNVAFDLDRDGNQLVYLR